MNKPRPVQTLLDGNQGKVPLLLAQAKRLTRLDGLVKRQLPVPLSEHCRVANVRGDTIVLQADSAAWAARLRYSQHQLLQTLGRVRGLERVRTITIITVPRALPASSPDSAETPRSISRNSAELLRQTADSLDDAPQLKAALERLARRAVS